MIQEEVIIIDLSQSRLELHTYQYSDGVRSLYAGAILHNGPYFNSDATNNLDEILYAASQVLKTKSDIGKIAVILPPDNFFSVQKNFPFNNRRMIEKVIVPEVQSEAPFDLEDFMCIHRHIKAGSDTDNAFHYLVSCYPRDVVKDIVESFNNINFPISYILPPSSALVAGALERNIYYTGAILGCFASYTSVTILMNGITREEYIFKQNIRDRALHSLLRCIIHASFPKTLKGVAGILVMEDQVSEALMEEITDSLAPLKCVVSDRTVADHCCTLIQDEEFLVQASQFRQKEFRFNPKLILVKELFRAAVPYSALALVMWLLVAVSDFMVSYIKYNHIKSKLHIVASSAVNNQDKKIEASALVQNLTVRTDNLSDQLDKFASLAAYTPLELIDDIANALPKREDYKITELNIDGNEITLVGTAKSFEPIDSVKSSLSRASTVFCDVRNADNYGGYGNTNRFQFRVKLCGA